MYKKTTTLPLQMYYNPFRNATAFCNVMKTKTPLTPKLRNLENRVPEI